MKHEIKDVFYCDYCNKHLFRKSSMTRHEKLCLNNPENHKKCLSGCKYLETKEIETCNYDYGEKVIKSKTFLCTKFDKFMFPFSIEIRKLDKRFPDTYEDQEPMPKECEGFEHDYDNFSLDDFNFWL